jgi:hypothetical protein
VVAVDEQRAAPDSAVDPLVRQADCQLRRSGVPDVGLSPQVSGRLNNERAAASMVPMFCVSCRGQRVPFGGSQSLNRWRRRG